MVPGPGWSSSPNRECGGLRERHLAARDGLGGRVRELVGGAKDAAAPRFQFNNADIRSAVENSLFAEASRGSSGPARAAGERRGALRARLRRTGWGRSGRRGNDPRLFLFLLPAAAVYLWLVLWPTVQAFRYSVTDWDGLSATFNEVGLNNYQRLLGGDSVHPGGRQFVQVQVHVRGRARTDDPVADSREPCSATQRRISCCARCTFSDSAVVGVRGVQLNVRLRPHLRIGQHLPGH